MSDPLAKSYYRRFRETNAGWLRRLAPLALASLFVLALGSASLWLLVRYTDGISNYRTPLAKFPPPSVASDPIVPQVVFVVIDGLREDATLAMPIWQRLRQQGASATVLVTYPTAQPAWTTLVTGAESEINDAPLDGGTHPFTLDSLFTSARRANLNVALAARSSWRELVAPQFLNEQFFSDEPDDSVADHRIADKAAGFIAYFAPNVLLVHLALPDLIAQQSGVNGDAYAQAAAHTDQLLAQLASAINLRQSVLIVASSYGVSERGGHGGAEDAQTRVPLLVVGAHVKVGEYGMVRQSDIAPTIAALIGSGIPSTSQGTILFSMFDLSDVQRATKAIALAKQQRDFGQAYLNAIGGTLSEPALLDAQVAKSSLDVKNYESAFTIANLAAQQVQHDTRAARLARIERERFARAPLVVALIVVPLMLWFRRSGRVLIALIAAIAIALAQHGLYVQAQHLYSFSDMLSLPRFALDALARSVLAVVCGGVLIVGYHWRDDKPSRVRVATTLLIACALAIYLLSIPFAVGYFVNGLSLQWTIGDLTWAFIMVFSLVTIVTTSVTAVPFAAAIGLLYWSALVVLHRALRARVLLKNLTNPISSARQ